jgi:hypothetical protein
MAPPTDIFESPSGPAVAIGHQAGFVLSVTAASFAVVVLLILATLQRQLHDDQIANRVDAMKLAVHVGECGGEDLQRDRHVSPAKLLPGALVAEHPSGVKWAMNASTSWRSAIAYPSRTTFSLAVMFVVAMRSLPSVQLDLGGTAIDQQLDARDVTRVVGDEERDGLGNLVVGAGSTERRRLRCHDLEPFDLFVGETARLVTRRNDRAGGDDVDANPPSLEIDAPPAREGTQSSLLAA